MNPEINTKRRYFDKEASVYRDFKYRQKYMEDQSDQMIDILNDMKATLAIICAKLNINTPIKCSKIKSSQEKRKNILSSTFNIKKESTSTLNNNSFTKPILFTKSCSDNCIVERRASPSCSNLPIRALRGSKLRLIPRSMDLKEEIPSTDQLVLTSLAVDSHHREILPDVNVNIASSKLSDTGCDLVLDDIYQDTTDLLVTIENPLHKGLHESDAVLDVSADSESIAESQSSVSCLDTFDILSSRLVLHASLQSVISQNTIFTFDASTPITHAGGFLISVMEFLLFLFSYEWLEVLLWWIEGFV